MLVKSRNGREWGDLFRSGSRMESFRYYHTVDDHKIRNENLIIMPKKQKYDTESAAAPIHGVPPKELRELLDIIADRPSNGFTAIQLFNSVWETGSASGGIESLIAQHEHMLGLHGFMAGFQFVVIGSDFDSDSSMLEKTVLTMQTAGFLLSLLGTLLSLVAMQFLNTLKDESTRVQLEATIQVFPYVRWSDFVAIMTTILLGGSTLLSMYDKLPLWVCIIFSAVSAACMGMLFYLFGAIILQPNQPWAKDRVLRQYRLDRQLPKA